MAIRFSPGCGCCLGKCEETTLRWIPSSPYDRGEYTDDDRWRPFTEYLQGDQFWEESTDRNGDTHKFLFTAPSTMMSGGGWTLTEESRYNRGRGISYADGLQDFELFGDGWDRDQIRLHEALQTQRLAERQGIVSRRELAKDEWIADWNVDVKNTVEYDDMEMASLSVRVKFMGSVSYDASIDDLPTSGIVTVVSKAAPHERVTAPYPEDCIPSCEAEIQQPINPDFPQCGPQPPFRPEWKIEHGTFDSGGEILDDTYAKERGISSLKNSRSIQPVNAVVSGSLDVPALLSSTVTPEGEPLDLHDPQVLAKFFGASMFENGFESRAMQNAVAVVIEGGEVTQGGSPFTVESGDIIQVVDFIKLDADPRRNPPDEPPRGRYDEPEDGAFKHIPAAEIIESDRTCYLSSGVSDTDIVQPDPNAIIYPDRSIEIVRRLNSYTGGRLAVYVEKFSDTDIQRTRDGEYFCEFGPNMCRVETPTSVQRPDCVPDPAFECECKPMDSRLIGVEFNNNSWWSSCDLYLFANGIVQNSSGNALGGFFVTTLVDSSDGIEWTPIADAISRKGDCISHAGRFSVAQSWSVYAMYYTFVEPDPDRPFNAIGSLGFGFSVQSTLAYEVGAIQRMDCIGQIDRAIMARSVIGYGTVNYRYGNLGAFIGGDFFLPEAWVAREAVNRLKQDLLNRQLMSGLSMFCSGNRRFNNNMTTFFDEDLGIDLAEDDLLVEGMGNALPRLNAIFSGANNRKVAASLHEWSLQTGAGEECSYAVTLKYPTLQEREDQIYRRHYETLFDCQDDPRALFVGQESTIFTA